MSQLPLQYLSALKVTGEDAASFLQAQLTADLTRLAESQACFSAYCDPKGNVLAVMRVIRRENEFLLIIARSLADRLIAELGKFVLRARVELVVLEDPVVGYRRDGTMEYTIARADIAQSAADPTAVAEWHAAELRAGIVWLNEETSGAFLPQMLGLLRLDAVSFRKGCFPGQEVIARVRYLGKVKRSPLVLSVATHPGPAPGDEAELLSKGERVATGVLVDSARAHDETILFLVTRNPQGAAVDAIGFDGQKIPVIETAQAWATM